MVCLVGTGVSWTGFVDCWLRISLLDRPDLTGQEACPTRLLEGLPYRGRAGECRFRFQRLKKRSHLPPGYMESSYPYAFEGSWRHRTYPTFPGCGAPPAFPGAALTLYRSGGRGDAHTNSGWRGVGFVRRRLWPWRARYAPGHSLCRHCWSARLCQESASWFRWP